MCNKSVSNFFSAFGVISLVTLLAIVLVGMIGIIDNTIPKRISYAIDYELNVLTKECTFETYKVNQRDCIKSIYLD